MAGEKTEKATPKRKEEERKKGNVFQSKELVTVASLLVMFTAFKMLTPLITTQLTGAMLKFWELTTQLETLTVDTGRKIFFDSLMVYAICAIPLLLISSLVAIVVTFAQTRMLVSTKSMEFKFSRLNPISGLKKLFSLRGLVELIKSIAKITILGYIIYSNLKKSLPQFPKLINMEPVQAVVFLSDLITSLINTAAAIFLFLAVADYVYQWWDYEKNLRMSKDEIKEEYKQTEGDPQIKGKIKEKQRQMAMSRMMQNVPTADVIVRNPDHFAVALKYEPEVGRAPRVVAKGMDSLALRIVKVAEEANVTTIENVALARGLYAAVELEQEIPERFYQPVAEVLAFVYSLKKKSPVPVQKQTESPRKADGTKA